MILNLSLPIRTEKDFNRQQIFAYRIIKYYESKTLIYEFKLLVLDMADLQENLIGRLSFPRNSIPFHFLLE